MRQGLSTFVGKRVRELAWCCAFSALLSPAAVQSLSLDEIRVRSHLGQPLEAVIPVDSARHETLDAACFSIAVPDDGLPGIERVRASFDRASGELVLRSGSPIREPLNEITVRVRCAGVPALERSFLVVLDPPDVQAQSVFARVAAAPRAPLASPSVRDDTVARSGKADAATAGRTSDATTRAAEAPVVHMPAPVGLPSPRRAPRPLATAPAVALEPGSSYLVQPGDTLSSISARVRGRPDGAPGAVAARIHARNPLAFLDGNPDRLLAGAKIVIPPLDSESLDAGAVAHAGLESVPSVALPTHEGGAAPDLHHFVLSTTFSGASMANVELRRRGITQAVDGAASRLPAHAPKPEAPRAAQPTDAVVLETRTEDDVAAADALMHARIPGAEDASSLRSDAVAAAAVADSSARSAPAAEAPAARPDTAATGSSHSSTLRWIVSALGAVLVGAVLGGIGVRIVIWRRQAAELHRRQSMRRASGLERSIRLDLGIVVKEHPAGTPLTVDASTQELAAIRLLQQRTVAPTPVLAPADVEPTARSGAVHFDFAREVADEVTLQIESRLTDLDLVLPEMPDLPLLIETGEVPTDIVTAATQREPLVEPRPFAADTDFMELAYRDETAKAGDPDATVRVEAQGAAIDALASQAYDRSEADPLDDTLPACERADESKVVVSLWNGTEEEETAPEPRARAAGKS
jgi:hypothetical protein